MGLGTAILFGLAVGLLITFGVASVIAYGMDPSEWLLWKHHFTSGGRDWYELSRATVGMVGAIGLWGGLVLAYRRQRTNERAERHESESEQHRRSRDLEDSAARMYDSAVTQLGHRSPTIRAAAMYTLARVGDAHVSYRSSVLEIWCGYLRTPNHLVQYQRRRQDLRAIEDPSARQAAELGELEQRLVEAREEARRLGRSFAADAVAGEAEARDAAQKLLTDRLRERGANDRGWVDEDLRFSIDLAGAHLHNANFEWSRVAHDADFSQAVFTGDTTFNHAQIGGWTQLKKAIFTGHALFCDMRVQGWGSFEQATFEKGLSCTAAKFNRLDFGGIESAGRVWMDTTCCALNASFRGAKSSRGASFRNVSFLGSTDFSDVDFGDPVTFLGAYFGEEPQFTSAALQQVALGEARADYRDWFRDR